MSGEDDSATRLGPSVGVAASDPSSPFDDGGFTPGTVLQARYRIVGLIGRGGMGEVYRAQDLKLGQSVALKFLPQEVGGDPARLERFLNEVRIARQISHPNVCRVYDVGDVDGRHFLSMEFVDGEDLASLLRRIGRLPGDKGVEVARQVCAGLAAAHDRGVLHRDLKPANIMIDGRGHARLADFGLAAAGADLRAGEIAGTPAYMAPEQLEGQELSTKSDIYALGLVLHELFTGKRIFDSTSVQELRQQHRARSGSQSTLTSSSIDVDPAVDRVIRRCLEPDPRNRPASALAVAAALPGGDPLAAALAAGETPSPELVAQAGTEGELAPRVAWPLLAAVVLGVAASAWLGDRVRILRLTAGMRSPEVLAARAEDLLDSIGYGRWRFDRVYAWNRNFGLMGYVAEQDRRPDRWERVVAQDLPAVRFWYRQSPAPLLPNSPVNLGPDDPPPLTPGMASVELSPRGRLLSLRGVPSQQFGGEPAGAADWSTLFQAAGIDVTALTPATPRRAPPMYADTVVAWEGRYPGRPDWSARVEAASYRKQPVWFVVAGPWEQSPGPDPTPQPSAADAVVTAAQVSQFTFHVLIVTAGVWLARRNVRAGRADRHGAFIVAAIMGGSLLVSILVGTHYAGTIWFAWQRFIIQLGIVLFWSAVVWTNYLALEPFVRRRWSEAMISWTRLLAGRFRDPLVARDILIGIVGGLAIVAVGDLVGMIAEWLGQLPKTPRGTGSIMRSLGPVSSFAAELLRRPSRMLLESMVMLFFILLAHAVLRNRWVATATVILAFAVITLDRADVVGSAIWSAILVIGMVVLVSRFGVLSFVAAWFVAYTLLDLVLSLNQSAWYAIRSAVTAAMFLLVAAWAFYYSLGKRSAFGTAFD